MKGKETWILVADEAIARVLRRVARDELEPVEELTDPAAHAAGKDLRTDAYGRRAGSASRGTGAKAGHAIRAQATATAPAGEDERHLEAQSFARRVAQHLAQARQQHRFDELHVAAAPRFLGLLRKAFAPGVTACIGSELDKDLVQADPGEIARHLFPAKV